MDVRSANSPTQSASNAPHFEIERRLVGFWAPFQFPVRQLSRGACARDPNVIDI